MLKKIMIDPGHAPGNANGGRNGYKEFLGMWKLSNFLKNALERYGFIVGLTRAEYADPSLTSRGRVAAGYDLFISQHSNAANGSARGVEVFYSLKIPQNQSLAAELSKELSRFMNNPNRGAKTRESTNTKGTDYYTVMFEAQREGAKNVLLVENGFHDNEHDEAILLKDSNLEAVADIQAKIIAKYLGVAEPAAQAPDNNGLTLISGKAIASEAQIRAYISTINPNAPDIAGIYIAEGINEGIRGDIAFAQSCLETGNFKYEGSAVIPEQHNYCGMGVTSIGMKGNSFNTPKEGIRAQIQHLKAYANTEPLNSALLSPRFHLVERGVAPYVEWLGAKENPKGRGWAMGENYGAKILRILNAIINTNAPDEQATKSGMVNFDIFGQNTEIPGRIENGTTIVHARPLVEAMGCSIGWNGDTSTVEIWKE